MADVPQEDVRTDRNPLRYLRWAVPVVICLAGAVMIFTIALVVPGIIVLIIGLIWGAVVGYRDRHNRSSGNAS
jgi:hypothetical protein